MSKDAPQLLKGFRDLGPYAMSERLVMFAKIRSAFERFGFQPMETPALEYASTLMGKYGAEEKLLYRFQDNGGREVALRYDHTVPLARFYQANKDALPRPFKRYAIGPVWRAENTQKGRFREFYQCDADCIGSFSASSDAECIAAISAVLSDLGVEDVAIRVNNRKIIDGLLDVVGIGSKKATLVLRGLDKLDKIGAAAVKRSLSDGGITENMTDKLYEYIAQSATDAKGLQDSFGDILQESSLLAEGLGELGDVLDALEALAVKNVTVDLKLARGLDYYTGTVCEMTLSELPEFGSIAGGGRYDGLIAGQGGERVPAVGMSIGIDRLLSALEELGVAAYDAVSDSIIFNLDERMTETYLELASQLRSSGINCDLYYQTDSMEKQFRYAEKKKINIGIFIGEDEVRAGEVTLKNLITRTQWKVKAEAVAQEVEKALDEKK